MTEVDAAEALELLSNTPPAWLRQERKGLVGDIGRALRANELVCRSVEEVECASAFGWFEVEALRLIRDEAAGLGVATSVAGHVLAARRVLDGLGV